MEIKMTEPIHVAGFEVPIPDMDNPEMRKRVEAYLGRMEKEGSDVPDWKSECLTEMLDEATSETGMEGDDNE